MRRKQLQIYNTPEACQIAKAIVAGKLHNQACLLKYHGKYRKERDPKKYAVIEAALKKCAEARQKASEVPFDAEGRFRDCLMGHEGQASTAYWQAFSALLEESGVEFEKRNHRGATDIVNVLLNYGYGILYSRIWRAVLSSGLEPGYGVLHCDAKGKPTLVFDLIEEFRQAVVDRTVLGLLNRGQKLQVDATGRLNPGSRRLLAERIIQRLAAAERFRGKRVEISHIIFHQVRHFRTCLMQNRPYKLYRMTW